MKLLIDTNIILDVLLAREPHWPAAADLLSLIERSKTAHGVVVATTITTLDYLLSKALSRSEARRHIATLMDLFEVAPVDKHVLIRALNSAFRDFEDAVLYHAALAVGVDAIVTRDHVGFEHSQLPVLDAVRAAAQLRL